MFEKKGYTYSAIVKVNNIKENKNERKKTIKEYKQRLRLVLEPKPHEKNKITAINSWAVVIFRY